MLLPISSCSKRALIFRIASSDSWPVKQSESISFPFLGDGSSSHSITFLISILRLQGVCVFPQTARRVRFSSEKNVPPSLLQLIQGTRICLNRRCLSFLVRVVFFNIVFFCLFIKSSYLDFNL